MTHSLKFLFIFISERFYFSPIGFMLKPSVVISTLGGGITPAYIFMNI